MWVSEYPFMSLSAQSLQYRDMQKEARRREYILHGKGFL